MKKLAMLVVSLVSCLSAFSQSDDQFRKVEGITWNVSKQLEYYKQSTSESGSPTFYYYEVNDIWRMTNAVPKLSWFYVSGWVKNIDKETTNKLVFIETFDPTLNRKVPQYCVALYPHINKLYRGDKISCLVYYSYSKLPSTVENDGYSYNVVQYGISDPQAEQSFLQQIKIQSPQSQSAPIIEPSKPDGISDEIKSEISAESTPKITQYNIKYGLVWNTRFTWTEAYNDAIKRGGKLAVFETRDKWNDFVNRTGVLHPSNRTDLGPGDHFFWIGLMKNSKTGQWVWISGAPLTYNNWHHLSRARPEGRVGGDTNADGNRGLTWENSTWNDAPNRADQKFGYIIEYNK